MSDDGSADRWWSAAPFRAPDHACEPDCAVCAAYAHVLRSWLEALADGAMGDDPVHAARRDPRVRRAVTELSAALGTLLEPPSREPRDGARVRPRA